MVFVGILVTTGHSNMFFVGIWVTTGHTNMGFFGSWVTLDKLWSLSSFNYIRKMLISRKNV